MLNIPTLNDPIEEEDEVSYARLLCFYICCCEKDKESPCVFADDSHEASSA